MRQAARCRYREHLYPRLIVTTRRCPVLGAPGGVQERVFPREKSSAALCGDVGCRAVPCSCAMSQAQPSSPVPPRTW